jgi:hypothetical protein
MTITLPHKHAKFADEDKREISPLNSLLQNQNKKSYKNNHKKGECNMTKKREE